MINIKYLFVIYDLCVCGDDGGCEYWGRCKIHEKRNIIWEKNYSLIDNIITYYNNV